MINETINFSSQVTVKDTNGNDIQIAYLNATLDAGSQNFTVGMSVTNKALIVANAESVKAQYAAFESLVKARAVELGYIIF